LAYLLGSDPVDHRQRRDLPETKQKTSGLAPGCNKSDPIRVWDRFLDSAARTEQAR
jgi:hypothetical protein